MRFLLPSLLVLFLGTCGRAQIPFHQLSPSTEIEMRVASTDIGLRYNRPSLRGRRIFGGLEPWNTIWRGGANRNPRLTMSEDFFLGDTRVKAGSYTLFSRPNPDRWTVYLYTDTDQYGVPEDWDESKVVATIDLVPETLARPLETLRYGFEEMTNDRVTLVLEWETTRVVIPLGLTTAEQMDAAITKTLGGPGSNDYSTAAIYYLRNDKDLPQALAWFDRAIAISEKPSYWPHLFRAQTLEKMGRRREAIDGAKESLALARSSESDYGIAESEAILERLEK